MSDGEEDDPIVLRVPVYVRPAEPQAPLCLFQYPLRPRWRPYNLDDLRSARCRPSQRRVEVTLGRECSASHYDGESDAPLTSIRLASTTTAVKTSYAIGLLHRNEETGLPQALCLTPLEAAVQLRPSFDQIDRDAKAASAGGGASGPGAASGSTDNDFGAGDEDGGASHGAGDDDDGMLVDDEYDEPEAEDGEDGKPATAIAPQFRPAQTEREIEARRSSHAFLVEQREAEPWSEATLHAPDSDESRMVRSRCFEQPARG